MYNNNYEYLLNQERLIHVNAVKNSGGPVQTYLVSFVTSVFPGNVQSVSYFLYPVDKCLIMLNS